MAHAPNLRVPFQRVGPRGGAAAGQDVGTARAKPGRTPGYTLTLRGRCLTSVRWRVASREAFRSMKEAGGRGEVDGASTAMRQGCYTAVRVHRGIPDLDDEQH